MHRHRSASPSAPHGASFFFFCRLLSTVVCLSSCAFLLLVRTVDSFVFSWGSLCPLRPLPHPLSWMLQYLFTLTTSKGEGEMWRKREHAAMSRGGCARL